MKTTLIIPDPVMKRLRERAARQGVTISELVESALRRLLDEPDDTAPTLPALPVFDGGRHLVDVANREALYHAMDGE